MSMLEVRMSNMTEKEWDEHCIKALTKYLKIAADNIARKQRENIN